MDELLTNIDNDVRKVTQESGKVQSAFDRKVLEMKNDQTDEVRRLRGDIDLLKERMDNPCNDITCDNIEDKTEEKMKSREPSLNNLTEVSSYEVEEIRNELTSFKHEMQTRMSKVVMEAGKMSDTLEMSTINKLEKYISTEVVDEIVETINGRLVLLKTEVQNDLEIQKIHIDETNSKVDKLKLRVSELESTKKCFNESELFASSVDLTRTPRLAAFLRTPTRLASPIQEDTGENVYHEGEGDADQTLGGGGDSHCSTPRLTHDISPRTMKNDDHSCCSSPRRDDKDQDLTLYEEVTSQRNMSRMSARSRNDSNSSTKCHEVEIAIGDRSSSSYDPVGLPSEEFGSNYGMIPFHREEQQDSRSKRRESLMSNIFINLTSILDV